MNHGRVNMGQGLRRQPVWRRVLSLFVVAVSMVNCSNIYEPMSSKTTDAAYYEDAVKALDKQDWDTALTKFGKLSSGFLDSTPSVRENYAGALAGKCGFRFATFYNSISSTNFGTTPLFKVFMNQFTQVTIYPTYCTLAEAQIKAIWASNTATAGEQLFMVLLSMAKMGAYLRAKADNDGIGNLGDGTTDAAYNGCTNTNDTHHLTDAEVTEIITGFSLMLLNIAAFAATLGLQGTVTNLTAACALLPSNPCAVTSASGVTGAMISDMRSLLNTNANYTSANGAAVDVPFGVGTCNPATKPLVINCCP